MSEYMDAMGVFLRRYFAFFSREWVWKIIGV